MKSNLKRLCNNTCHQELKSLLHMVGSTTTRHTHSASQTRRNVHRHIRVWYTHTQSRLEFRVNTGWPIKLGLYCCHGDRDKTDKQWAGLAQLCESPFLCPSVSPWTEWCPVYSQMKSIHCSHIITHILEGWKWSSGIELPDIVTTRGDVIATNPALQTFCCHGY